MTTSPSKPASSFTRRQKLDELWRRGVLAPFLLHETQKKMYAAFKDSPAKRFVINSSRRIGKSYLLCLIALEHAIQNPGSDIKIATGNQKMTRKIITPLIRQLLETCPKELRPKFRGIDGTFEFGNGSMITVCGTEMGQIDGLRGTACDLVIIDEAGFVSDLEYALESVLIPQTLTRPKSRIILASTPPVTPDHAFVRYALRAMRNDGYAKFTIYDNPMLSREQIEEFKEEAGGENSTTWRREYLAEFVVDKDSAILPEGTDELLSQIVTEVERPPFFNAITSLDLGYLDFTGGLFAYYDFPRNKIVIQDEFLVNKSTSATIVAEALRRENELWGPQRPKTRVVDANAMAIADLNETHRFNCHAPEKSDLQANVNRVRMDLANGNIIIHPRCINLINQIKYGTWDKQRSKFSRSSEGGHWDLLAALIYLCRHIDRVTNPFPASYGYNPYTDWGYPRKHTNNTHSVFARMFRRT